MLREKLLKLSNGLFDLYPVLVIDHDRKRELPERLALHAYRSQGVTQLRDSGGFRIIDQLILRAGILSVLKI